MIFLMTTFLIASGGLVLKVAEQEYTLAVFRLTTG